MLNASKRILQKIPSNFSCSCGIKRSFIVQRNSLKTLKRNYSVVKLNKPKKYLKTNEITLFIKGFLAKNENPHNFKHWFKTHKKLVENEIWEDCAKGWYWESGRIKTPIPYTSGFHFLWTAYNKSKCIRLNPMTLLATGALDAGINLSRIYLQYNYIQKNLEAMSEHLTVDLTELAQKYDKVRIVCHSLGSKLYLNAIQNIDKEYLPDEVYMLGPAFIEDDYSNILDQSSKDKTVIYYSENDWILKYFFKILNYDLKNRVPKFAVGEVGLENSYNKVDLHNVSEHFKGRWIVHSYYPYLFDKLILSSNE